MIEWSRHLVMVPVALPLLTGALLLLVDRTQHRTQAFISVAATMLLVVVAARLLLSVDVGDAPGMVVYRIGNWPVPIGIVFVLDRLSALMVLLTAALALAALTFALAQWQRAGSNFHSLFQFLLAGLMGAFLTGDLFNLFVFLEVLLAASYGLVLHGSGESRVRAGLHYIVVNLVGASLLLIGISLIYGVTGTLNMADIAMRMAELTGQQRALAGAGAAILGTALLIKAGMWPLCFWLPTTYAAASAPVAAVFAVMTKVGIYAILRLWLLVNAGTDDPFGGDWLLIGGVATIAFGTIGVLASQTIERIAGYSVLISSGTLLTVIGSGAGSAIGSALYYMVNSTIALGVFFLLIEIVERGRAAGADIIAVTMEAFGEEEELELEQQETGVVIPGLIAFLGIAFMGCALLLAGMPPLSGFIAKFAILSTLFDGVGTGTVASIPWIAWLILFLILASGIATLIAASRAGVRTFWAESEREIPQVRLSEALPIAFLILLCVGLTVGAGPVMRYMEDTAQFLRSPDTYIEGVFATPEENTP